MPRQVHLSQDRFGLTNHCHRTSRSTRDHTLCPDLRQARGPQAAKVLVRTLPIPHLPPFMDDRGSNRIENVGQWPIHIDSGLYTQEPLHWYPQSSGLPLMLPPVILSPILPSGPPPPEPSKALLQSI